MDARKPTRSQYYRPELDVLRFIAFLLVFFHHNWPPSDDPRIQNLFGRFSPVLSAAHSACGFGLSLFFTLSAFLICELLLRERELSGTVGVKQFYIRRSLRIWPLYYLALIIGTVIAVLPPAHPAVLIDLGWFAVFMGAWFSNLHGWIASPVSPLWSISVEEQFYVFAPWIVKYLSRRLLYGFCGLLILVANALLFYSGRVSASDESIWTNTFVQFECFAAGILLCLVLRGRLPTFTVRQRVLLVAGWWFCWMFTCYGLHGRFGREDAVDNPGSMAIIGGYALASLGSVLLLMAFLGLNAKWVPRWAIYLGRISFGLYVYHQFAINTMYWLVGHGAEVQLPIRVFRVFMSFGMTFLLAALSYRYFETPFLRIKKRFSAIESEPVGMVEGVKGEA